MPHAHRIGLFLFAALLWAAAAAASPGTDLLSASEDFILMDMEKSMSYAEKAIGLLKSEVATGEAKASALSKAYYVKAYLLTATKATDQELLATLADAVHADPNFEPPSQYASHPKIKQLLPEARKASASAPCSGLDAASALFQRNDFCGAYAAICPDLGKCADKDDMARMIATVSLNNCPAFQNSNGCPSREQAEKNQGPKLRDTLGNKRIGVMPLLYLDVRGRVSSLVHTNDLLAVLRAGLAGADLVPLQAATLKKWSDRFNLDENYSKYVVREYQITAAVNGDSLIKDGLSKEDFAIGGVPRKYSTALRQLLSDENIEYALFTMFDAEREDNIELRICLYHVSDPGKPKLIDFWRNISMPKYAKNRLDKIPPALKGTLAQ
ncbi:hypothetical protein [Paucidesulfovibrio longus]|uniref:hypothetical protein n=1 Tax=Paucidesulfovibrio longus TaxID=889 RepID=UPI0003B40F28|nr:hypothetical protein [Paucidesulfovibrio longus]